MSDEGDISVIVYWTLKSVLFAICSARKSKVFYCTNEEGVGVQHEGVMGVKTGKGFEGQM